jgi:hypothetical protein
MGYERMGRIAIMMARACLSAMVMLSLASWAMFPAAAEPSTGNAGRPLVGAIRWDAWHGSASKVRLMVEKTLAPAHWHYRLPFYARVTGENTVEVRGHTQEVMDQEIAYAHGAGMDYWAFVVYPEDDALSLGLKLYLASEKACARQVRCRGPPWPRRSTRRHRWHPTRGLRLAP